MKRIVAFAVIVAALFSVTAFKNPFESKKKFAIILQADTDRHEGLARAVHAMLYAKELIEDGHDVTLIFDGAGTHWAEELSRPEGKNPLIPQYVQLKKLGVTEVICDFCANAFEVKKDLVERGAGLVGEYEGHPSIAKLVDQGYQLLVL